MGLLNFDPITSQQSGDDSNLSSENENKKKKNTFNFINTLKLTFFFLRHYIKLEISIDFKKLFLMKNIF